MKEIIIRSQKAKGSGQFKGPDLYIAVVTIPDGGESVGDHPLSVNNRIKYGWQVEIVGECYSQTKGPRSQYWKLMEQAESLKSA